MDGPRDPLASADSGADRPAPPCALTTRLECSSAHRIPECGGTTRQFEEPVCGERRAGLARNWASKPGDLLTEQETGKAPTYMVVLESDPALLRLHRLG
jgi:hypothetical protein